jgi:hypothetical protein
MAAAIMLVSSEQLAGRRARMTNPVLADSYHLDHHVVAAQTCPPELQPVEVTMALSPAVAVWR